MKARTAYPWMFSSSVSGYKIFSTGKVLKNHKDGLVLDFLFNYFSEIYFAYTVRILSRQPDTTENAHKKNICMPTDINKKHSTGRNFL